jgi:hypothetical protein
LSERKGKIIGSAAYAFDGAQILSSYVPKKNRRLLFLSTVHGNVAVNATFQKPQIIRLYNETKGGADGKNNHELLSLTQLLRHVGPVCCQCLDVSECHSSMEKKVPGTQDGLF